MYPQGQPYPHNPGYPGSPQPSPYPSEGGYATPAPYGGYQYPPYPAGYHGGYAGPELASWGRRAVGYLIDYVIQMVIIVAVAITGVTLSTVTAEAVDPGSLQSDSPPAIMIILILLTYVAAAVASFCYRWLPHANSGRTVGKRVMGIRLVKEATGQPVGKGASAGRELVYFALSAVTCIGVFLDLLWPLWDDKNQTLHDKVVGGIVIHD